MRSLPLTLGTLLAIAMTPPALAQQAPDSPPAEAAPSSSSTVSSAPVVATEPMPLAGRSDVGYDKGFFIKSTDGLYKMKINGRVQTRHELHLPDGEDRETQFSIPRARLKMGGHAFNKDVGYKLQVDFGKGATNLKDFYVDYKVSSEWLHVRAGQYKKPFSRQQLTSSGKQILVDRAITDKAFGAGRDIGLMFHNGFGKKNPFEYALGIFNGTGDKGTFSGSADLDTGDVSGKFSNLPGLFEPAVVLRLGYNLGKIKGYSGGDFTGGGFRLGVGTSAQAHLDTAEGENTRMDVGVDLTMKVAGFSLDTELFMRMEQDGEGLGDQRMTNMGLYAQAGYLLAGRYLPIVRYERLMPEADDSDEQVITGGFGVFFFKHGLKLQTELSLIDKAIGSAATTRDLRVLTQLQMAF